MKGRPAYRLWRKAKTRAAAQGVAFDLTVDDVEAIWPADNICPALGLQMREGATVGSGFLPSIDRLIPQWGYTRGNVAVISMRANMLKNNGSAAELEQIAAWMKSNGLS